MTHPHRPGRLPAFTAHADFRRGMRDMARILPGFGAWGLVTGVAMVKGGLSVPLALLMSLAVFAGSAQLAAVPLMLAGAPVWVILATAFCVNLRFVIFSAQLRPYLSELPRRQRVLTGYVIGDLSYVLFVQRFHTPPEPGASASRYAPYLLGLCAVNWLGWQVASISGILLANAIPQHWGLGFAGVLALLGLALGLVNDRNALLAAVVAGTAAVAAYSLPLKLYIVTAIAAAVAAGLLLDACCKAPPAWGRPGAQPGPEAASRPSQQDTR